MGHEIVIDNKRLDEILMGISERDFERLLETLPEDMNEVKELLVMRKALVKLFSDRDYYEAVKGAVCEMVVEELFGSKEN